MPTNKLIKSEINFIVLCLDLVLDQLKEEVGENEKRKKMLSDAQEICTTIKIKLQ
jgi:hypothetical protein